MRDPRTVAEAYLAVWNAGDAMQRLRLLEGWGAVPRYRSQLTTADGREALASAIGEVQARYPGHRFALRGTPDAAGNCVRVAWIMRSPSGAAVAAGTSVMRLDAEERIAEVVNFLDGVAS